ncbi:MAG TPA: PilN domain-containing protein [Gemmatimonadales bacterium]|nr:PilN domain-containing protein [Gemmatimonadales bacterium]
MIEVNLLPGRPAEKSAGFKLRMPDFRAMLSNVTNPWLLAACAAWILVLGGGLALFVTSRTRLAVLNSRLEAVRTEKRRYDAVIAQKRQSERMRDSLAAEIGIIRSIDGARYIWPHILDQVAKALPPYTWLNTLTVQGSSQPAPAPAPPQGAQPAGPPPTAPIASVVSFQITGSTVDIQAYTTFLRQLAASPWFTDVFPASSQTIVDQDRPVTAFTIAARFRVADSVYMHTVPLTQPLR